MMKHLKYSKNLFFLLACLLVVCTVGNHPSQQEQEPGRMINVTYERISRLLEEAQANRSSEFHLQKQEIKRIYQHLIGYQPFTNQVLGEYREKLNNADKAALIQALEESLVNKSIRLYYDLKKGSTIKQRLTSNETSKYSSKLAYVFEGEKDRVECVLHLTNIAGEWVVSDLESNGFRLTTHYRQFIRSILKKYSFPVLIAELQEADSLFIDDFSDEKIGSFPQNWRWKESEKDEKLFAIREENGNRYLNVRDRGGSVIYGREFRWNIKRFPYISWRWRIHSLPDGGDERYNETNDSAAAVYIMYDKSFIGVPKVVKYVWSTTLPVGTATRRKGIGRPWTVVAKSGNQEIGIWHTEVFNALETFRKTFGGDPPDATLGIAILTDANATKSLAEADYDTFKLLRTAQAGSGVKRFLEGGK
jgi:ABC-type transporter MlaC component